MLIRRRVVALSVGLGSAVVLVLSWLGIIAADGPTSYGNAPTTIAASGTSISTNTASGLVEAPPTRATPAPIRRSRAS